MPRGETLWTLSRRAAVRWSTVRWSTVRWSVTRQIVAVMGVGGCMMVGAGCTDGGLQVWTTRQPPVDTGWGDALASSDAVSSDAVSPDTESPTVPLLVDDFEDGDTRAASGLGWWYTQSDTTGQQTFQIEPSGNSAQGAFSAHYSGFGFRVWGAMLGLDFTPGEGQLDASNYGVLQFRARVAEGSVTQVSARLLDPDGQYSREIELTSEWRDYELVFAELVAVDGSERLLDASRLTQFHLFIFSADYFDLWLDDFVFR